VLQNYHAFAMTQYGNQKAVTTVQWTACRLHISLEKVPREARPMGSEGAVTLTESTTVQVTMKQLAIGLIAILIGLFTLAGIAISAAAMIVNGIREDAKVSVNLLRDDVKEIRSAVQGFQNSNAGLS
jgi:hypothetical protein